jgi:hypothetical protein
MRRVVSGIAALSIGLLFGSFSGSSASSKILVCHKGKTLEVAQAALGGHLGHGDPLGSCDAPPPPPCSSSSCLSSDAGTLIIE